MTKPGDSPTSKGACITAEMRKDREDEPTQMELDYRKLLENAAEASKKAVLFDKEHKLRQEAEGELSILRGIETNRVKEAQARSDQLQDELDRVNKEKNDLFTRIAELIEANEKEVKNLKWIKDHDYIFLIDENKKLRKGIEELKNDNKKLARQVEDRIDQLRKSGL